MAMNAYNFTERVRDMLAMATQESRGHRHEYVGTEHILLALISQSEGIATAVLQNLQIDVNHVRELVERIVKIGRGQPEAVPNLPYTSRAQKVLQLAMAEAADLNHTYVATEHILLGILREEKGIAAQVLTEAGLTLEAARAETRRLLGLEELSESDRSKTGNLSSMEAILIGPPDPEIVALEEAIRAAQLGADVAALDRLISEDLLFTGPGGGVGTKAEDLEAHRSGAVRFLEHEPIELRIRRVGDDVAVTSLLAQLSVRVAGKVIGGTYRYTRVWARENGQPWKVVGGHVSAAST